MTGPSDADIAEFLKRAGWADGKRTSLAGDASSRSYERLEKEGKTALLMKDPSAETVERFLKVTRILQKDSYSAPEILAEDPGQGLALLEDFGDHLFFRLIEDGADETALYRLAVDFLIDLTRRHLPDGLPYFSESYVLDQNVLFLDWYIPSVTGKPVTREARLFYQQVWRELLKSQGSMEEVLLMRDFHAENIFHLEGRTGLQALGLIDYQDAMIGPAAYDLVSLLQDARRDVPRALEEEMIGHYVTETGVPESRFRESYAILGAHRALRIMGIFTRLSEQDGKNKYLAFMPRMKRHLKRNLAHPALVALEHWLSITVGKEG